jgi:hypothetical protein
VNNTATVIGTMINTRSGYIYGSFLPPNWLVTNGIGYKVEEGKSDFAMPSRTFSEHMTQYAKYGVLGIVFMSRGRYAEALASLRRADTQSRMGGISRNSCTFPENQAIPSPSSWRRVLSEMKCRGSTSWLWRCTER